MFFRLKNIGFSRLKKLLQKIKKDGFVPGNIRLLPHPLSAEPQILYHLSIFLPKDPAENRKYERALSHS